MTRLTAIALGVTFILTSGQAVAQGYQRPSTSPFQTPPVSPYLNMLRGGNPGLNYYDLVRPQQDTRAALQRLQQQQNLNATLPANADASISITGHPARFMNFSHYYYYNIGAQSPVAGIRSGSGGAGLPNSGVGQPAVSGSGLPSFSFITGTGVFRP
jgi:hypothetical protein